MTSSAKPQHSGTAFWAAPATEEGADSAYLTFKNPITIPSTGTTTLKFSEWYFNEDGDKGFVEVSTDNGATWTAIYTNARSMGDLPTDGADAFANEGFTPQALDLTVYSGQTIRLRFRYFQDGTDFFFFVQYGWYIDDISITNDSWVDATHTAASSFLAHKPSGTYCYRVRTTYPLGGVSAASLYSNVVNVTVAPGIARTLSRKTHGPAGPFEIDTPMTGPVGIESRKGGGANGDTHQVIFQFGQAASFTTASATPQNGKSGQVASTSGKGTKEITVNLSNVTNAQTIMVTLNGVTGAGTPSVLSVPIGILRGDVNADRSVDSGDVSLVRQQTLQPVTNANFRADLNTSGDVDSGDVSIVRQSTLTGLP